MIRRLLARLAYRWLRPEIDALTHPWVKIQREQLENQRKIHILVQQQGPLLEAIAKVIAGPSNGPARY